MKIAITDANIFIDLVHVGLVDELFRIGVEVHTTINVIDELNDKQLDIVLPYSARKILTVHSEDEFASPEDLRKNKKLSDSDKSVFSIAFQLKASIPAGDGLIRQISDAQKIEVHGIPWLFDQFLDHQLITKNKAVQQLKSLQKYDRLLPQGECERRITDWS